MNLIRGMLRRIGVEFKELAKDISRYADLGLATVGGYISMFPDAALDVWNQFPADLKATIPESYVHTIGVVLLIVSLFVRTRKRIADAKKVPQ